MKKLFKNRFSLKEQVYTLHMKERIQINGNFFELNKVIRELSRINVNLEEENMSLFLLSSFLSSYKHLVRTFLYRKGKTDMEDVTS